MRSEQPNFRGLTIVDMIEKQQYIFVCLRKSRGTEPRPNRQQPNVEWIFFRANVFQKMFWLEKEARLPRDQDDIF